MRYAGYCQAAARPQTGPTREFFPAAHFVRAKPLNPPHKYALPRHGGCTYVLPMGQLRFAALLVLLAAGCYREAADDSTLPEPHYISGPPGGAIDQPSAYARGPAVAADPNYDPSYDPSAASDPSAYGPNPGGAYAPSTRDPDAAGATDPDDDSDNDTADASPGLAAPSPRGPSFNPGAPGSPGIARAPGAPAPGRPFGPPGPPPASGASLPPGADDIADSGDGSDDPAPDLTANVTDPEIDATLDGYGQWIETDDYGQVWRPDATVVGVDFTPYESGGSWEYTDAGWGFACDYPWGWLPFHYGRWAWFHGFWGWVPGYHWGPAWVEWRHGGGVVGWRPLAPRGHGSGHRWNGGDVHIRDHRHAEQQDAHWRFATTTNFARPHIRSHLFTNPAEGLRVTAAVAAPPLRSRSQIRAADLMRNRLPVGAARGSSPGAVRDHRPSFGQSPTGSFSPPTRYRPPTRTQPNQLPVRSYPPARPYPGQPGQTYQPPARPYPGQTYQPPARPYPGQTYQPPAPGTQRPPYYQPNPGSRPPVYQPNPSSRPPYQPNPTSRPPYYQPNSGSRPPVYQPNPSSRPPVYQPNPSSRQPSRPSQPSAPSPAPSRSWGTPSPSSSGGSHSSSPPPSSSGGSSSHSSSSGSSRSSSSSSSSSNSSGGHHR